FFFASNKDASLYSSRRLHTRFSRDWSSDVCSSDLVGWVGVEDRMPNISSPTVSPFSSAILSSTPTHPTSPRRPASSFSFSSPPRSEERRVGKDCRTGLSNSLKKLIHYRIASERVCL